MDFCEELFGDVAEFYCLDNNVYFTIYKSKIFYERVDAVLKSDDMPMIRETEHGKMLRHRHMGNAF